MQFAARVKSQAPLTEFVAEMETMVFELLSLWVRLRFFRVLEGLSFLRNLSDPGEALLWLITVSGHLPYTFPILSLCFPFTFPILSLYFPYTFPIFSLYFPYNFPTANTCNK
jgi:hypothetical protein